MVPLASGVLDICVSSTSFQKMISASLNSLQQKEYQVVVKNWIYVDSFHKKRTGIGQLGARDDQTIMISNFFDEMRLSRPLRLLRPLRPLRSLRLQRF
jgi:hypothetical protein